MISATITEPCNPGDRVEIVTVGPTGEPRVIDKGVIIRAIVSDGVEWLEYGSEIYGVTDKVLRCRAEVRLTQKAVDA